MICLKFLTIVIFLTNCLLSFSQNVGLAPGLYCGLKTCYEVLGIDRDDFTKSELSRLYRNFAKKYHPDRVTGVEEKKIAAARFREVATAYETLKDDETKQFYDHYLDHPEDRYYNYYQYYRMKAAPKVDIRIVIIVTIILVSAFQYLSAKQKYSEALSYAITVPKYRQLATNIAVERKLISYDLKENMDIRGGYKKESFYDTLLFQLIIFPYTFVKLIYWYGRWYYKYNILNKELEMEDKIYLICKYLDMTESQFHCLEEYEQDLIFERSCWIKENAKEYKNDKDREEKEKLMKSAQYRRYKRYMKNNAGNTISFLDD
ncbi:DnaJ homolog subfamily C member 25 [Strongyloides ratti]|uniref:DnaJ homolog subfamily C member 25 n=1 Tax=Strongyloides ratti TaxID=34506 RepID=A0A090L6X0_STRRB|nr:DnaJ homolog subfamily C member 25 [Strongyloides ratti]CEF65541.1 DnaJ homolog subfamily C member 25 [Strongyloides ratti]